MALFLSAGGDACGRRVPASSFICGRQGDRHDLGGPHDANCKFDADDLRQLENLDKFASAAYQATEALNAKKEFKATSKNPLFQHDPFRNPLILNEPVF